MEHIVIKFADGTSDTYNTEDWDNYEIVDFFFCVKKDGHNVGIFNMRHIKSITMK